MPTFDPKKNFAVSTVLIAPVPALTGTTLQVAVGEGALFPATGAGQAFNAVVFPANAAPSVSNAEIVRCTRVGDVFTIARTQEGTTARAIQVGDRIMDAITVKSLTDIENALATAAGAIVLAAQPILEPGVAGQVSRGRVLTLADFTTLLGLTAPVGGWNLSDLTDFSGNGRALTNKGAVTFGGGIMGAAAEAALFTGSTGQALYISDAGAGDPFRIKYGSVGCWMRTAKKGTQQMLVSKWGTANQFAWELDISSTGQARFVGTPDGTGPSSFAAAGVTDLTDDRWHFVVGTYDGSALSIYVDGMLEAVSTSLVGALFGGSSPLNIGAYGADGVTAATTPSYGRVDEAFVTADVLSPEQIRMLYAAKVAHGFGAVPIGAKVAVRRLRRGAALLAAAFSTTPLHLYNFIAGALTDAGSLGNALTNNNAATVAAAADGAQGNAYNFVAASSQNLSATDAGLPAGTTARSLGAWIKTAAVAVNQGAIIGYGGPAPNYVVLRLTVTNGFLAFSDNATDITSAAALADGQWHFVVVTVDNAAADGLKTKLYADGKLVFASTTILSATVLAGANGFLVGKWPTAASYWNGQIDRPFVTGYAMSSDEVAKLYAQGSLSLGVSPKNAGDHVEGMDGTNVYLVADTLGSQNQIDLEVTA